MAESQDATRVTVTFSSQQLEKLKRLAETLEVGSYIVDAKTERGTQILVKRGSGIQELELAS